MLRRTACAVVLVTVLGGASAAASGVRTITDADSGKTFVIRRGVDVALRLRGPWVWSDASTSSASVRVSPVEYFAYPGYQQWTVVALRRGRATITATGHRRNAPARRFRITLVVAR